MGLDSLVRSGVAIANSLTASLQVTVLHHAWIGQDAHAKPAYAAPVSRQALVERKTKLVRDLQGKEVVASCVISLIGNVSVDLRDKFTLPDGKTAPTLAVEGLADPAGGTFVTQVFL